MQHDKINKYIFVTNKEVWEVVGHSEQEAKLKFIEVCRKGCNTDNDNYRSYWTKLHNQILDGDYISTQIEDFNGVRKIC